MSTIHYFDAHAGAGNLGDLEKTITINSLITIPLEERDNRWVEEFIANISDSNLVLSNPDVMISSEGFPYFNVRTVEPGENFQAFVINQKLGTILQNGFGIAINAHKDQPDWMFTYGDILNLALNEEFYTEEHLFSLNSKDFAIGADEELLVGQPSEDILPSYARKHIREYLQYMGVKNPMLMLIARNYKDETKVSQDLAFNLTPSNFSNAKEYQHAMNTLAWFLPKHYSLVGIASEQIENGFEPI
ncbi:hypothetical protein ACFRAE_01730 [Sphingobacterium sp. HJSM2_6]|uniref:hypothetical protein n=1 Tax=Sphingobacterium sp. HJSM2_6 TaxID=3366264 RepID=UPI003BCB5EA3